MKSKIQIQFGPNWQTMIGFISSPTVRVLQYYAWENPPVDVIV